MLFPTFLGCDTAPQFPEVLGGAPNKIGPLGFWLQINQGRRGQLGAVGDEAKRTGVNSALKDSIISSGILSQLGSYLLLFEYMCYIFLK